MKYYTIPGEGQTLDSAYAANEGKEGGRYPIGKNKCWHSGTHINTGRYKEIAVKPLIGGELAAYRISAEYERAPLRNEMSAEAYSKLNDLTRSLYRNEALNGRHTFWKEELTEEEESWLIERVTPGEYNELPEEMKFFYKERELVTEIRDMYKWDSGKLKYVLLKKIAASFILLRHEVSLPPSTEEKIKFYTLYMGIVPGVPDALKEYLNRYEGINNDVSIDFSEKLPFYQTWQFKLTVSNLTHRYYETRDSKKKLIKGSLCSFSEYDENLFLCKFENAADEEIKMPKDSINNTNQTNGIKYYPKRERVPVYKDFGRQWPLFAIAELRVTCEGKTDKVYFHNYFKEIGNGYSEVMINPDEIYDDLAPENEYIWWCKGVRPNEHGVIPYRSQISVFYKNNDAASIRRNYKVVDFSSFLGMNPEGIERQRQHQSCGVIKYDPEKIEMEYSNDKEIVSVRNKNGNGSMAYEYKNEITIPLHPHPIVIIKNPMCQGIISFLYSDRFRTMNAGCYEPPTEAGTYARADTYSRLMESRKTNEIVKKLTVSHLLPLDELSRDEKINLNVLNRGNDSLPEKTTEYENLRQCRLACGEKNYKVLVKKEDLKIGEAKGMLNEKIDEGWTDGGKLTVLYKRGAVLYDGPSEGSNARDIMPVSEEKFEITNPASLYRENERCGIKNDGTIKYASFKDCELKTGVFYKDGYGYKEGSVESDNEIKIMKEPQQIARNEILGYPNPHHQWNDKSFYDLVCFFTDKKFLDKEIEQEDAGETNLFNWKEHFIVEKSDKDGDLFCDSAEGILRAAAAADNNIDVDGLFEKDYKGRITGDEFLKAYKNDTGYKPVALGLRRLVCRHPLEWDVELYREKEFKKKLNMRPERFEKLKEEMELLDIWKGGGAEGIKEAVGNPDTNSFWFAHPLYFINHLNDAGLLVDMQRVESLIKVQDRVVKLKCLIKGTVEGGMFSKGGVNDTYCNQATFLTIQSVDGNYCEFIGYPKLYKHNNTPPWSLNHLEDEDFRKELGDYKIKNTNIWCDILRKQASNSSITGICRIEAEEAQEKANFGYVVIAAWQNKEEGENPPHYATVRPDTNNYNSVNGPFLANVGGNNDFFYTNNEKAFGTVDFNDIEWYYNRNQAFQEKYDGMEGLI